MAGTTSKPEGLPVELVAELETLKAMNEALRAYLEHVHALKKNLGAMHANFKQLSKINEEWINSLKKK